MTTVIASPGKGVPQPSSPRLRRKSAKAAAALVSAVAKEEVTVPEGRPAPTKRSYSRSQSAPTKSSTRSSSAGGSSSSARHANKKKTALSQYAVQYLKNWMLSPTHIEHPYPTEEEKVKIMKTTGIEIKQLTNWFVNNRKRYWKPKVEEYKRRSSETNLTVKEIAAKEWSGFDDNNAIVSDEGTDTEKSSQPKKKKQKTSASSKNGGGGATISPGSTTKGKKNKRDAKGKQGKAAPPLPVLTPGIAVAKSHATVKAANAMRYVGDTSSSDEELEEDAATIFSSSTVESKVNETTSNDDIMGQTDNLAPLPMEWSNGVCGCVADPLAYKVSHNGEPCALCAACRDWNAGEFCPWDLTGIIGNISESTDAPAPVERMVSSGELDLDAKMTASPSSSTFETPQDTSNETWEIADTW